MLEEDIAVLVNLNTHGFLLPKHIFKKMNLVEMVSRF